MPNLTRDQFNQIIEWLVPYVSEDHRQSLIQRAFWGEPVVDQLAYSGQATIFAINCLNHLKNYNNENAIIQLLETLRDHYLGAEKKREVEALLVGLREQSRPTIALVIPAAPTLTSHLFISYSRRDLEFVNRLRQDLQQAQVPYWIDKEGLSPGTPNWERAIRAAIETCSAVLWIVSPAAYESEYVNSELAVAELYQRKIYPMWADGANWIACVPLGKHNIQFVDLRGANYPVGLGQLLAELGKTTSELSVPPPPPPPPVVQTRNPYKGLAAFTAEDVTDFFGREALVERLIKQVQNQLANGGARFLAVLGPSGAGKSSVVMAGLLPKLAQGALADSDQWRYLPRMVPGVHPMERLATALEGLLPQPPKSSILPRLYTMGVEYINIVGEALPAPYSVLYVDQFEELFTLAADASEQQQFVSLLTGMAQEPDGKMIVLLSMRADFLDQALNYPALGALLNQYSELVQPMSIPELSAAIQQPARLPDVGLTFEADLVVEIIFALRARDKVLAGALPLLEFTLSRLYEGRAGTTLTWAAYRDMGGVAGAIGQHSEAVFATLSSDAQAQLGTVFLPLVNIDDDTGEPTRRRAAWSAVVVNEATRELVQTLIDQRLLQSGRDESGTYVEVAHEALFRSWERLKTWIATTHDDLRLIRQAEREAVDWERGGRAYLLTAERLQTLHAAVSRLAYPLSATLQAFLYPQAQLLVELSNPATNDARRLRIGDDLALLGDPRAGVGVIALTLNPSPSGRGTGHPLRSEGEGGRGDEGVLLPDIAWLPVTPGGDIKIEKKTFTVQPFYIAQYLITYRQFQTFVEAADGFNNDAWWQDFPARYRPQTLNQQRTKQLNSPRDTVSWYQVVAFSRWMNHRLSGMYIPKPKVGTPFMVSAGHPTDAQKRVPTEDDWIVGANAEIRLPTEWEWQWAAQGGVAAKRYPWGAWQGGYANTSEAGLGRTTAVGMYPHAAADCGALDIAGNLWEWCLNDYNDPTITNGSSNTNNKVLRGGAFSYGQPDAACASSSANDPSFDYDSYGCRLVVAPLLPSLTSK